MINAISDLFSRRGARKKSEVDSLSSGSKILAESVLFGLCLRYNLPLSAFISSMPDIDLSLIRKNLSEIMLDPAASRLYFDQIDRFDAGLISNLGLSQREVTSHITEKPCVPGSGVGDRLAVPSMPVAARPLSNRFRAEASKATAMQLGSMPASTSE